MSVKQKYVGSSPISPAKIIKNLEDWFESNMGCILIGDRINHFYSMPPLTAGRFGFLIITLGGRLNGLGHVKKVNISNILLLTNIILLN